VSSAALALAGVGELVEEEGAEEEDRYEREDGELGAVSTSRCWRCLVVATDFDILGVCSRN